MLTIPNMNFSLRAFNGQARWLQVTLRCPAGSGNYTILSPRQALAATPYALFSKRAPWGGLMGVPAGFADKVDNDTTYSAGAGLALTDTQFSVTFAGTGAADTAARSDHDHYGAIWGGSATMGLTVTTTASGSGTAALYGRQGSGSGITASAAVVWGDTFAHIGVVGTANPNGGGIGVHGRGT